MYTHLDPPTHHPNYRRAEGFSEELTGKVKASTKKSKKKDPIHLPTNITAMKSEMIKDKVKEIEEEGVEKFQTEWNKQVKKVYDSLSK